MRTRIATRSWKVGLDHEWAGPIPSAPRALGASSEGRTRTFVPRVKAVCPHHWTTSESVSRREKEEECSEGRTRTFVRRVRAACPRHWTTSEGVSRRGKTVPKEGIEPSSRGSEPRVFTIGRLRKTHDGRQIVRGNRTRSDENRGRFSYRPTVGPVPHRAWDPGVEPELAG